MASIKNLEMAETISADARISIKKTFFGHKAIYLPTGSEVKGHKKEYSAENGEIIKGMLKCPDSQLDNYLSTHPRPASTGVGPLLMELCASGDKQFAAVQAFTFYDLAYHPVQDMKTYEGATAEKVIAFLIG